MGPRRQSQTISETNGQYFEVALASNAAPGKEELHATFDSRLLLWQHGKDLSLARNFAAPSETHLEDDIVGDRVDF